MFALKRTTRELAVDERGLGVPDRLRVTPLGCGMAPAYVLGAPSFLPRACFLLVAILFAIATAFGAASAWAQSGADANGGESPPAPPAFEDPFADPFATEDPFGMESTDWDSVFAAVDRDFDRAGGWFEPLVDLSYDKVAGLHIDGGLAVGPVWDQRLRTETRLGYDFGRSKPTAQGGVRIGDLDRERYWLGVEAHSGITSFGSHQPYTNTLLTFVGGYDARSYLREEGGEVRLSFRPTPGWTVQTALLRTHQAPSPLRADFHLFGSDRWMEQNAEVDRWTGTGLLLLAERRPRYSEDVVLPGLYARAKVLTYRGALSSGSEFSRWALEGRRVWQPRGRDELYVAADLAITAGSQPGPSQFLQDIGGHGGLRGFEPRFVVGTQRAFIRTQFAWANNTLGQIKLPVVGKTKLRLVPFAEVGSVWGRTDRGLRGSDLSLPDRSDIHWDLGLGLRRIVDSSGLLSYLQVDFAWPMGADTGPARITLTLSSRGFD